MVDALSELHDIHLPAPISFWPPAPGYYIIALVLILFTVVFFIRFYTRKSREIKRAALEQLSEMEQTYQNGGEAHQVAAQISVLLKQVALLYYPRETVASLQGDAWLNFLIQSSKKLDFKSVQHELIELPFHPGENQSVTTLLSLTKRWIKQRSARCLS
jgi:hypothetical protein